MLTIFVVNVVGTLAVLMVTVFCVAWMGMRWTSGTLTPMMIGGVTYMGMSVTVVDTLAVLMVFVFRVA